MYNSSLKLGAGFALVAYAYFGAGVSPAQATVACTPPDVFYQTYPVTNNEYVVAQNAFNQNGTQCLNYNSNGDFSISTNTSQLLDYPHITRGQSYGEGPTTASGMPVQVSSIWSMPVTWNLGGSGAPGSWDAMFEAWMWTTFPPAYNSSSPAQVIATGQADGTELMVWLGASGQIPANLTPLGTVAIAGVVWDVRASRWGGGPPNSKFWNYIAYFAKGGATQAKVSTDFKAFLDDAKTRTGSPGAQPCANGAAGNGFCLYDNWYMQSMQAGFELFSGGVGLSSSGYSAKVNVPVSETNYGQLAWAGTQMLNLSATDLTVRHSTNVAGTWGSNSVADGTMKRVAACMTEDQKMDFWGIGAGTGGSEDSRIYHKRQNTDGSLPAWQATNGWAKEIACQDDWLNLEEIVYIGTDDHLYNRREISRNNWVTSDILVDPNAKAKHIAVSYNYPDGALQLVYTDLNNNLHQTWQTLLRSDSQNNPWGTPISLTGSAVQLAMGWNFDGTITLVYAGTDSKIHYRSTTGQFNAPWSADTQLSGTPAKQVALMRNFGNSRGLFYVGTDSKIYYRQAAMNGGASWSAETLVASGPATQFANSGCGIGFCGGSLFYTNPNGKIYHVKQTVQNGAWSSPQDMNATAAAP